MRRQQKRKSIRSWTVLKHRCMHLLKNFMVWSLSSHLFYFSHSWLNFDNLYKIYVYI
jgi:hypothetical protein